MADHDFPSALPAPLSGNLEEDGTDPWVSDSGAVGSSRRRKRFTRALKTWTFTLDMSVEERAVLVEFYDDELDSGTYGFNWTHPITGEAHEVKFDARPKIKHAGGGGAWSRFTAEITLNED